MHICRNQPSIVQYSHYNYSRLPDLKCKYRHSFLEPSIYLSSYLSIYLYVYQSICLSIYLSIYQSINQSIYLSIYLSIYISICLSIYLSTYLHLYRYMNIHNPVGWKIYPLSCCIMRYPIFFTFLQFVELYVSHIYLEQPKYVTNAPSPTQTLTYVLHRRTQVIYMYPDVYGQWQPQTGKYWYILRIMLFTHPIAYHNDVLLSQRLQTKLLLPM